MLRERKIEDVVVTHRNFNYENRIKFKNKQYLSQIKNKCWNFLNICGYDLNSNFIKKYYDPKSHFLSFKEIKSTKNQTLLKTNHKYNKTFEVNKQDIIVNHIFSAEKIDFKESTNKNLKYFDHLSKYHTHAIIQTVYGSYFKDISDVLILDIDCHDENFKKTNEVLNNLQIEAQNNIFHLEKSTENSFHAFIKLDKNYTLEEKYNWIKKFNQKYNCNLETLSKMVFPLSYTYASIQKNNTELAIDQAIGLYSTYKGISLENSLCEIQVEDNNVSMYCNFTQIKNNLTNKKDLYYGRGYRIQKWYKEGIIFSIYRKTGDNYEQFCEELLKYDLGSKDILLNREKVLNQAFLFAKKNYKNNTYKKDNNFIDNSIHIEDKLYEERYKITDLSLYYAKKFLQENNFKHNTKKTDIEQLSKLIENIIKHTLGTIIYQKSENYKRKINDKIKLTKEKRKQIEEAIIFEIYQNNSYKGKINIKKLFNFVLSQLSFIEQSLKPLNLNQIKCKKGYKIKDLSNNTLDNIIIIKKYIKKIYNNIFNIYKEIKKNYILYNKQVIPSIKFVIVVMRENYETYKDCCDRLQFFTGFG